MALYCKETSGRNNLKAYLKGTTNGLLSEDQAAWIASNFDEYQVSFDLLEEAHNKNRPLPNGQGSYDIVLRTIKKFRQLNFPFLISAVADNDDYGRIPEMVEKAKELKPRKMKITCVGAGKRKGIPRQELNQFYTHYEKGLALAKRDGIGMTEFNYNWGFISDQPCFFHNYIATPDGHISSCPKVGSQKDPLAKHFLFGRYDKKTKKIKLDKKMLEELGKKLDTFDQECEDCFAKFYCQFRCPYLTLSRKASGKKRDKADCPNFREQIRKALIKKVQKERSG